MSTGTLRQLRNWGQHNAQATRIATTGATIAEQTQKVFNPKGGPATDGQKDFIRSLLDQLKAVNPGVWETAFNYVRDNRDMNSIRASDVITRLRAQVAQAPVSPTPPVKPKIDLYKDVVDGYYAVTADEGHTSFYRVSTFKPSSRYPTPGRKVQLQLSDNLEPVSRAVRDVVLRKIREAGPDAAAMRYAREIGRCYRCGRTLTDAESRSLGIGPTCRSK